MVETHVNPMASVTLRAASRAVDGSRSAASEGGGGGGGGGGKGRGGAATGGEVRRLTGAGK